ncbi:MAG: ABC transporter ATP-binding protein [Variibacter sp.]
MTNAASAIVQTPPVGNRNALAQRESDIALRIAGLSKRYPGTKEWAVSAFDLAVPRGDFVALLGPSGCGKTTTLRMLAGLVDPTGGEIFLESKTLSKTPAHKRNIGLVFQHYALFPLMSVFENVAYGLRERRVPNPEIKQRVADALSMVHLSNLSQRKPKELSGGQQQRVALARALVINPSLLLLDEPLSNLDAKLRHQVRAEIKRLQEKLGITTLFVTHDQEEALSMAHTVVVMRDGVIEQVGTPEEIYQRPATAFVASFVGSCNFIKTKVESREAGVILCGVENSPLKLKVSATESAAPLGTPLTLAIRPERVDVTAQGTPSRDAWPGTVIDATYLGAVTSYEIEVGPQLRMMATVVNKEAPPFEKGSAVSVSWTDEAWRVLA